MSAPTICTVFDANHPAPRPLFDRTAMEARERLTEAIRLRLIALGFVAKETK